MRFLKYTLIIFSLIGILIAFFYDDVKQLFNKVKKTAMVKFNLNVNNPFNIVANAANKWNGKTTKEGATFESFDTIENGVRAGIKLLKNYISKLGRNTVRSIIEHYAPRTENDTENYIAFVCREMDVKPDQVLTADKETLWKLSEAVCKMENGFELSRDLYDKGWKLI